MSQDIDRILKDWEYQPGGPQARMVQTRDGRDVVQLRLDLGLLQMEVTGRPDGTRPHGYPTYLDYLRHEARMAQRAKRDFTMSEEQCLEADREFLQYYHRRICWLALREFDRALRDADHTLTFMDFVRDHSPSEEYTQAHEQYRGFVLYHRTQAAAAAAMERDDPESAVDALHAGLARMREFFQAFEAEDEMEENPMVQQLRSIEQSLRERHQINATLQEQLEEAVAREEYETAARIRDELRRRMEKKNH